MWVIISIQVVVHHMTIKDKGATLIFSVHVEIVIKVLYFFVDHDHLYETEESIPKAQQCDCGNRFLVSYGFWRYFFQRLFYPIIYYEHVWCSCGSWWWCKSVNWQQKWYVLGSTYGEMGAGRGGGSGLDLKDNWNSDNWNVSGRI